MAYATLPITSFLYVIEKKYNVLKTENREKMRFKTTPEWGECIFLLNEDFDERISQKGSSIYKSKWVSFVFARI